MQGHEVHLKNVQLLLKGSFCRMQNMMIMQTLYFAFCLMVVTKEPLDLGM